MIKYICKVKEVTRWVAQLVRALFHEKRGHKFKSCPVEDDLP